MTHFLIRTLLAILLLTPALSSAQHPANGRSNGHPVIRSFHLGARDLPPDHVNGDACGAADDACCANSDADACNGPEEAPYFNPPPCRYCMQCNYRHWCPYCGYCPLYDDSDIIDRYDDHASWPSKNTDSWMRELGY